MNRQTKRKIEDAVWQFPPLNTILGYLVPPASSLLKTGAGFFARSSHDLCGFELTVTQAGPDLMFFHADVSYDGILRAYSIYAVDAANVIIGGHTWMENDRFMVRDLFHTVDPKDVRYLIQVCTYLFGWCYPKRRPVIACTIYQPPWLGQDGFQTLLETQPADLSLCCLKPEDLKRMKSQPLYGLLRVDIDRLCGDFTRVVDSRTEHCAEYSLNDNCDGHLLKLWQTEDGTGSVSERGSLIIEVPYSMKPPVLDVQFRRKAGSSLFELVGIKGTIAEAQAVLRADKNPRPRPTPHRPPPNMMA
jgi:hypothetical protein